MCSLYALSCNGLIHEVSVCQLHPRGSDASSPTRCNEVFMATWTSALAGGEGPSRLILKLKGLASRESVQRSQPVDLAKAVCSVSYIYDLLYREGYM